MDLYRVSLSKTVGEFKLLWLPFMVLMKGLNLLFLDGWRTENSRRAQYPGE